MLFWDVSLWFRLNTLRSYQFAKILKIFACFPIFLCLSHVDPFRFSVGLWRLKFRVGGAKGLKQ